LAVEKTRRDEAVRVTHRYTTKLTAGLSAGLSALGW